MGMYLLKLLVWWHSNVRKKNVWLTIIDDPDLLYLVAGDEDIVWDGGSWVGHERYQYSDDWYEREGYEVVA